MFLKLVVLAIRQLTTPDHTNGLLPVSDNAAKSVLAWSMILSAALILPQPLIQIASDSGADSDTALLMSVLFGGLFVLLVIVMLIRLRHQGAAMILGDGNDTGSRVPPEKVNADLEATIGVVENNVDQAPPVTLL